MDSSRFPNLALTPALPSSFLGVLTTVFLILPGSRGEGGEVGCQERSYLTGTDMAVTRAGIRT